MHMAKFNTSSKIGVAVPAHNRIERTLECLSALFSSTRPPDRIVVVDAGSTDGTTTIVKSKFPEVFIISATENFWWAASTNLAVIHCLAEMCDYILLLNQDCIVWQNTVETLLNHAIDYPNTLVAATTVNLEEPEKILWAGGSFQPCGRTNLIFKPKELFAPNTPISLLPQVPIKSDLIGGRGVLISSHTFSKIGLFDDKYLPQYGADNDFGLRAKAAGFEIHILPNALVGTRVKDSTLLQNRSRTSFITHTFNLLFKVKNGALITVWWTIAKRHTPSFAVLPTYVFLIAGAIKRAWRRPF